MTSRNQGLSPNDKGRQRKESLGTRLKSTKLQRQGSTTDLEVRRGIFHLLNLVVLGVLWGILLE